MENIENTAIEQETTPNEAERTFTAAEVNKLINRKYAEWASRTADYDELKAKAEKYDAAEEAAKSDLQKAQEQADKYKSELDSLKRENEVRDARNKVATEKGIPANLLTGNTEEECAAQADAILAWRGEQPKYPNVKDAGENTKNVSAGKTRDQFANWFNNN